MFCQVPQLETLPLVTALSLLPLETPPSPPSEIPLRSGADTDAMPQGWSPPSPGVPTL
jgi:hypothetical protein